MDKTVLQIPVSKSLRLKAEGVARDYGFSSLQEVIRVFMAKLAKKAIDISFQETTVLSSAAEKRYQKMLVDTKKGKKIYQAKDANDLIRQLNGDTLPTSLEEN